MSKTKPIPSRKVLWLDLETSGTNPHRHGITELGCILEYSKGKVIEDLRLFMNPEPCEIIDAALKVQERTRDEVLSYPPSAEQLQVFLNFLSRHVDCYDRNDKLVLAGYNCAAFDSQFLRTWFRRHGNKYFGSWFFAPTLDVYAWVAALVANGLRLEDFRLSTVALAFGIEHKAHSALEDAKATRELWYKILGKE